MTTASSPVVLSIPLDQVGLTENVREVDHDHVEALAGSIKLRGLLVPVIVRPDGEGYCLVAGFHRFAALKKLGWAEIRAEVHNVDCEGERTDRAIENIASCRRRHDVMPTASACRRSHELLVAPGAQARRRRHNDVR